jgi:branched-chain amino acid transport system substrate-binding protein
MIATKLMSDYVSNELKLNRVAILHSRGEYGESARDGLQENLQKAGVQIVRLESFNQGDKDLTSQLLNLKRANANGIIFWGYAAEGVIYAKQKKQLDVPGPLLVNNDVVSQVALKLGAADLEGAVGPAEFIPTDPDPRVQQFTDKYKKKYGDIAIDFHAPLYYDGLRILAEAVKLGGGTRNDQIQAGILKVKNFKTFVGTYSYDGNGDVGVAGLLVQIKNGNPIILKRY